MLLQILDNGSALSVDRESISIKGATISDSGGITVIDFSTFTQSLTLAAGKSLLAASGAGAVDLSPMTGTFKTPTGAHTINGAVTLAAGKGIAAAAGAGALDFSLATGDCALPTGAVSWAGASGKAMTLTSTAAGITITSATSGAVRLDGAGAVQLGNTAATSLAIGNSSAIATWGSKQAAGATTNSITDPGNAGAIPVTADGVCNLTTAGAETRTVAIPTFVGQKLTLCQNVYAGAAAVTFASAINVAGNTVWTTSAVDQNIHLIGCLKAGTRCWRVIAKDGGTLS